VAEPTAGAVAAVAMEIEGSAAGGKGSGGSSCCCVLCVVGSYMGSQALVSFDTHFVDYPGKQFP
jgi:hypothetical protein